jgi:hypothetical protein
LFLKKCFSDEEKLSKKGGKYKDIHYKLLFTHEDRSSNEIKVVYVAKWYGVEPLRYVLGQMLVSEEEITY